MNKISFLFEEETVELNMYLGPELGGDWQYFDGHDVAILNQIFYSNETWHPRIQLGLNPYVNRPRNGAKLKSLLAYGIPCNRDVQYLTIGSYAFLCSISGMLLVGQIDWNGGSWRIKIQRQLN